MHFVKLENILTLIIFDQDIEVGVFKPDANRQFISTLVVDIDFYTKKKVTQEMYNSDEMAKEFLMQFANQVRYILFSKFS